MITLKKIKDIVAMDPRTNIVKVIFNDSVGIINPKTADANTIFDKSEKYFEIVLICS